MTAIAKLIGGAGTGKTTELMRLLSGVLESGVDPLSVGFVSFTRAARREASTRAVDICGGAPEQLEQDGWFRTLHSVCFRCLGESRGSTLGGDKESAEWAKEHLDAAIGSALSGELAEDADFEVATDAGIALSLWSAARNRLEPLSASWKRADRCSDRTPPYEDCAALVERYEQAKRLDGKCDFTDLLGRFSGWRFGVEGHERAAPEGDAPSLPVWFFDEQQDTSALLDSVCRRLIESASWVYVVGDPFQAIYGWAGADSRLFRQWPADKERTMPKSYRCPAPVHELGESILRQAGDYFDRGIQPADHEGSVELERWGGHLIDEIDPSESWLLLARTNWLANRVASRLKDRAIPWAPTKGQGGWNKPARMKVLQSLRRLAIGTMISGADWRAVLKLLPAKAGSGQALLERGTKADWSRDGDETGRLKELRGRHRLGEWGATAALKACLENGAWPQLIEMGAEYSEACVRYGEEVAHEPRVRVGTVHSAKGAEADNVLWLTTTTAAVSKACEDTDGFNEECRVSYVAATRARKRLIVAVEPNKRHRWKEGL
ncbi:MAG: ATP-dependent helicase [Planctomycetota bacterium]